MASEIRPISPPVVVDAKFEEVPQSPLKEESKVEEKLIEPLRV